MWGKDSGVDPVAVNKLRGALRLWAKGAVDPEFMAEIASLSLLTPFLLSCHRRHAMELRIYKCSAYSYFPSLPNKTHQPNRTSMLRYTFFTTTLKPLYHNPKSR